LTIANLRLTLTIFIFPVFKRNGLLTNAIFSDQKNFQEIGGEAHSLGGVGGTAARRGEVIGIARD
jgi:hypothetical protein